MEKIYSHLGHSRFDINRFMPIKNIPLFVKPSGGFWGSPMDSTIGWGSFVIRENLNKSKYKDSGFQFKLKDAKILTIENATQLDDLPHLTNLKNVFGFGGTTLYDELDFEKLATEYDAIEVYISKDYALYERLYGWDVDSVLVLNPNVVEMINLGD